MGRPGPHLRRLSTGLSRHHPLRTQRLPHQGWGFRLPSTSLRAATTAPSMRGSSRLLARSRSLKLIAARTLCPAGPLSAAACHEYRTLGLLVGPRPSRRFCTRHERRPVSKSVERLDVVQLEQSRREADFSTGATSTGNQVGVFAAGTSGTIYYKHWNGAACLAGQTSADTPLGHQPGAYNWGPNGQLGWLVTGTDSNLYRNWIGVPQAMKHPGL